MKKIEAIREVFEAPDTFTIRPVTYGEMNPVVPMNLTKDDQLCADAYAELDGKDDKCQTV